MAVMDEFQKERDTVKNMNWREKLDYFVYYHKVAIMVTALIVIIAGVAIVDEIKSKEIAMNIALIDCIERDFQATEEVDYTVTLSEKLGIDSKTHTVNLNDSFVLSAANPEYAADESVYQLPEVLFTQLAAGALDGFISQESTFNGWVMNDGFLDLREEMSPEQYEYYKDSFYWIDYDLLSNYELDFDEGAYVYNENHRSPEGMKDPMPVGVYITPCEEFRDHYTFLYDQEVVFALTYSTNNEKEAYNGTEKALEFLDYLSGRTEESAN